MEGAGAMKRWVKMPGPGEFRGDGRWEQFEGDAASWSALRTTGYLPTHEGDAPPTPEEEHADKMAFLAKMAGYDSIEEMTEAAKAHIAATRDAPYLCRFCGAPSWIPPSEQTAPPDYCHPSDHGAPEDQ